MNAIEIRGLSREIVAGGTLVRILQPLDLVVPAGQFLAIMGPSGSGKSTLLGLMAGFDTPSAGDIVLAGESLRNMNEDALARLRRRALGFVFQSYNLIGNLTALENVALPLELAGTGGAEARAMQLLEAVGLARRVHHYPAQLSGGEQQRIALARAFAPRPSILLADEPTGNLDSENGRLVLEMLTTLHRQEGTTLVLVTHDPALANRADRVVQLRDGRIVADYVPGGTGGEAAAEAAR